jgi:hypothetical protein
VKDLQGVVRDLRTATWWAKVSLPNSNDVATNYALYISVSIISYALNQHWNTVLGMKNR